MWKYLIIALALISQYHAHAQTATEPSLSGIWYVVRWETTDRLLDFQDTLASLRYMVENYKQKNKLPGILKADSIRIRQELRKVLSSAQAIRFKLVFNKDKSFLWSGSNESSPQFKGTYALSPSNTAIVLTSFDGLSKAYRTMSLKLHSLQTNQMTIEIPSEDPGYKQSKFTLMRL
ncbi:MULTISPECIES: hypothetical protein [Niastella]|uniref:Lipocalin-like domain-containing protein n=1 Tax=Niastella soli TaxID=2821487 RepID=A0ABS3YMY1_9BACT|nr:hypothetical protein [Niastella soli]MBO9199209.1 hypothetical protein [Niastella soli]